MSSKHPDLHCDEETKVYDIENDSYTLLCIVGIRDVLRESVPDSIKKCIRAGIKVRMVTGDNKITAEAISKQCGIIDPKEAESPGYDVNEHVWSGKDFYKYIGGLVEQKVYETVTETKEVTEEVEVKGPDGTTTTKTVTKKKEVKKKKLKLDKFKKPVTRQVVKNMDKFNEIYEKIDVIARCRPDDKYAMVIGLITNGNVVAVTGDGTNDAPALKRADVGFAMKIGTKWPRKRLTSYYWTTTSRPSSRRSSGAATSTTRCASSCSSS